MRSLQFAVLSMLVTAGTALAHAPAKPLPAAQAAIARAVLEVREQIRTLVAAKDAKGLVQVYTDDFSHTHGSGKIDSRDNRIVALLSGDPAIELAPVDELLVRVPGPGIVIVNGRSPVKSLADGRTHDFRWTQVFVKSNDRWQMAVSQATTLPPPEP